MGGKKKAKYTSYLSSKHKHTQQPLNTDKAQANSHAYGNASFVHRPLVVLGFLHQQPRGSGTSHVALRASFSASPPRGHATCGHGLLPTRRSGAHEGPSFLLGGELLEAGGREPVHLLLAFRPATQRAGSEAGPVRFPEHLRQRNSARALPGAVDTRLPALAHRVEHTAALGDKTGVAEERDEPPQHSAAPPPSAPPPRPAAPAPGGLHTRRRWALRRRHSRPHMRRSGCTRAPILRMREGREGAPRYGPRVGSKLLGSGAWNIAGGRLCRKRKGISQYP